MINDIRRHPLMASGRKPVGSAAPRIGHYVLGFSLVIAATIFILLHHFMAP